MKWGFDEKSECCTFSLCCFCDTEPRAVPNTEGDLSNLAARDLQRGLGCFGIQGIPQGQPCGLYWIGAKSAIDHHLWCQDLQSHWNKIGFDCIWPSCELCFDVVSFFKGLVNWIFVWMSELSFSLFPCCFLLVHQDCGTVNHPLQSWASGTNLLTILRISNVVPFTLLLAGDRYQSTGSPFLIKEIHKERQDLALSLIPCSSWSKVTYTAWVVLALA